MGSALAERFSGDFMFQLTKAEYDAFLRCQIGASSPGHGGRRYRPYAFTEQGVAMLSSVLSSRRAVEVNIAIVRTFVKLREILADNVSLRRKIESLERKYDEQFQQVFKGSPGSHLQLPIIVRMPRRRLHFLRCCWRGRRVAGGVLSPEC